jgi:hypothetical protein
MQRQKEGDFHVSVSNFYALQVIDIPYQLLFQPLLRFSNAPEYVVHCVCMLALFVEDGVLANLETSQQDHPRTKSP